MAMEPLTQLYSSLTKGLPDITLSWDAAWQLMLGAALLLLMALVARRANRDGTNPAILQRLHMTPGKALFLTGASLLLWLATGLLQVNGLPNHVLRLVASLTLAWCAIRFATGLIGSKFWSRMVALAIWGAAALMIMNLLLPLLDLLHSVAFNIGKQRFSLLLILKGLLTFAVLLWGGSLLNELIARALDKSQTVSPSQKVIAQKTLRILTFTLAVLISLNIAGLDLTVLAVFGGAVGIGVGFGLQRIFANLVSGFILLMDRSIKPGDVISVMDTYGWVNRLGARYVSILTRDGKEHLIPNEKLITEQVENWSYSDDKVRLHIPVTVSYEADIHLVKQLLLATATENKRILNSPMPVCLLLKFAENGIEFDVRVWIRDPVNGIANVRSSFYFAIWDKFREAGIRFPYPQRDVHLKLDAALLAKLGQPAAEPTAE